MTRVLFLDIDGVLNSEAFFRTKESKLVYANGQFDPEAVARLNLIVSGGQAQIVVSSTWRIEGLQRVSKKLRDAGVRGHIAGVTPEFPDGTRSDEIRSWLRTHPSVTSYVIVDDESLEPFEGRFLKTSFHDGLTADHVTRALAIFAADSAQ